MLCGCFECCILVHAEHAMLCVSATKSRAATELCGNLIVACCACCACSASPQQQQSCHMLAVLSIACCACCACYVAGDVMDESLFDFWNRWTEHANAEMWVLLHCQCSVVHKMRAVGGWHSNRVRMVKLQVKEKPVCKVCCKRGSLVI